MKVHDARDGFNDLKPELFPAAEIPWFWVALAMFAILLFLKLRTKKVKQAKVVKKPLSDYLIELEALKTKINSGAEAPKVLSAEGSLVVRRFVSDRSMTSILESTPNEVEKQLENTGRLSSNTSKEIAKVLLQLETISFSEQKSEIDGVQRKALQLIDQSAEILQQVEEVYSGRTV